MKLALSFFIVIFSVGLDARNLNPKFLGFTTSAYDGSMGGIKGMNQKCNADYSGSHVCSYREIKKLGYNTTLYSGTFWVVDGLRILTDGFAMSTKDGYSRFSDNTNWVRQNCRGWNTNSAGIGTLGDPINYGASMTTTGFMLLSSCASSFKIPCCN